MIKFNKEELINKIEFVPLWVRDSIDFRRYSEHLKYRLYQKEEMLDAALKFLKENVSTKKYEDVSLEIDKIYSEIDSIYNCIEIKKDFSPGNAIKFSEHPEYKELMQKKN